MNGYNYLDGANPGLTNLSPDADKIIQDDGWLGGVRLHPDYAQYADEEAGWNAFGKGTKYNANNQTTSADSLKGLYPYQNGYRYFAWNGSDRYNALYSPRSIQFMSEMITKGLQGVHPEGKKIIVKDDIIKSVADSIFQSSFSDASAMQQMVVSYIINHIKNETQMIQQNNKLSIWITNYGVESGMKRFDGIKLNESSKASSQGGSFYVRY